jgi:predicted DNA repair protein MutK
VITAAVYGVVGLIVKMDDIGLDLSRREPAAVRALGRGLVRAMPRLLAALAAIGVAAMIWVGGGIIVHGLHEFHLTPLPEWLDHASTAAGAATPVAGGFVAWVAHAAGSGLLGVLVGGVIVAALHAWPSRPAT